jgi:hypothetical protein
MMNPRKKILLVSLFGLGLFLGMNLNNITASLIFSFVKTSDCGSLDGYYSGEGFFVDLSKAKFHSYYKVSDDGFHISNDPNSEDWDCEDISHAIYCLAKKYDIDCEFYYKKYYNHQIDNKDHFGIVCNIDGRWMELN